MVIGEAQVPANTLLGLLEATGGVVAGAVGVGAATALVHVAEGSALGAGGELTGEDEGISGYGLPDCLRISIGLEDEMRAVVEALGAFMGKNAEDNA